MPHGWHLLYYGLFSTICKCPPHINLLLTTEFTRGWHLILFGNRDIPNTKPPYNLTAEGVSYRYRSQKIVKTIQLLFCKKCVDLSWLQLGFIYLGMAESCHLQHKCQRKSAVANILISLTFNKKYYSHAENFRFSFYITF